MAAVASGIGTGVVDSPVVETAAIAVRKTAPSRLARASALTDDAYENNDTQSAAWNLGTVTAPKTISGLVMADSADWYKFTTLAPTTASNTLSINFLHSQGDID